MRIAYRIVDYLSVMRDPEDRPARVYHTNRVPHGKWRANNDRPYYRTVRFAPHPRTIYLPVTSWVGISMPAPPLHRWRITGVGADWGGVMDIVVLRRDGTDRRVVRSSMGQFYTSQEGDPHNVPNLVAPPASAIVMASSTDTSPGHLADIRAWAVLDISEVLQELIPIQTTYEVGLLTPLTQRSMGSRSLQRRSYRITMLVERGHPQASHIQTVQVRDRLEIETIVSNLPVYVPCAVASVDTRPVGGALTEVVWSLEAIEPYAYDPRRIVSTRVYDGSGITGYVLNGDTLTPVELRLIYESAPQSGHRITIQDRSTGDSVTLRPDAAGIWSIYDDGRIYHLPIFTGASPCIDRTDVLVSGALPMVMYPGEGALLIDHTDDYPDAIALAYYPRYIPELIL